MKCVCISCFNSYNIRIKNILNFFNEKGYKTTYIISNFDHQKKIYYKTNYENTETIQIHVSAYQKNLSPQRLASHYNFSKSVYKELCRIKPDIIYCIFPPNSLVKEIIKYKKNHNIKIVFDMYDTWPESFPIKKYEKLLNIPFTIWKNLRDKYINDADLLITVCESEKIECNKLYPNLETRVIYPFIEKGVIPDYKFKIDKEVSFCYLGNVNFITNIPLLVSFLLSLTKHKKVKLHIIGKGQNLEELKNKLENNNIEVICHGTIFDEKEKNKIFELCDFGINMPYEEINSDMALKYIEYLKVGIPIINSGLGDNNWLTENENIGFNIDENKIEKVVDDIINLTSDDLQDMHRNCIKAYNEKFLNPNYDNIFKTIF